MEKEKTTEFVPTYRQLLLDRGYSPDELPSGLTTTIVKAIEKLEKFLDEHDVPSVEGKSVFVNNSLQKCKELDEKICNGIDKYLDRIEEDDEEDEEEGEEVFSTGLKPTETFDKEYLYDYCVKLIKHVENAFISVNELIGVQVKLSILEKNKLINLKDIVLFQHKEKGKLIGFYVMYRADYDKEFLPKKK